MGTWGLEIFDDEFVEKLRAALDDPDYRIFCAAVDVLVVMQDHNFHLSEAPVWEDCLAKLLRFRHDLNSSPVNTDIDGQIQRVKELRDMAKQVYSTVSNLRM